MLFLKKILSFVLKNNLIFLGLYPKAQASLCVSRVLRWWEKISTANMIEIQSAQELVDTLVNAGDKLIVLDFYSPGCGGCRALHPKVLFQSIHFPLKPPSFG